MKKIGLIGGLSWVATAHYYRRINELTQAWLGGVHSARIAMESVDRQDYVDAVIEREDEAAACAQILDAAAALERARADFLVITCNDVHRFVPELAPRLGVPFLHIAEATAAAILAEGLSRVALLGVRKTMEGDFYPSILSRHGIETIVPNEAERAEIHATIYDELVRDVFREETRARYRAIVEALAARGAEGVILGCTEIPLLVGPQDLSIPSFSTTELHCAAAVARAIG
ncbi:aspartate/glutamate racemase family protein [Acuticoccus mangrovi]|uniref:Amino acid racemase n=1 Tax=Acuticoccus mangrovi TaxID=2796142 RepID=A0A934MDW2_9HYPH|nr:amino acid racemase [Acuticoccus mangrovi]MBJ3776817.1 amino acid racemase [Acuticoccus mangrovi]